MTLIGLNESGKTTILEAISTFQVRGGDEKSLYQAKPTQIDPSSFVPKHEKATFTGEITVTASIEFEGTEKADCITYAERESGAKIDPSSVPDKFTIRRGYRYENGDRVERISLWSIGLMAKNKGKRSFSIAIDENDPPWKHFSARVSVILPEIVYFPTFLFEQPDKIILNPSPDERPAEKLYRNIIENIGKSLEKPIDIKTNIVDRILIPETVGEVFVGFFSLSNNRQQQIESAINQLSQKLSSTVLDSWTKIFGGSNVNREIRLKPGVDKHSDGSPRVYVQFSLRDGIQQYDISERSLGFRWFFSFLLFTLYRGSGLVNKSTVFLLDEPAANLHAGAQMQLIESFPRITKEKNFLIYSTHSHYMINPEWLDQAYIISNDAIDYDDVGMGGSSVAISSVYATKYRNFVGKNPDKTTYFQPVLDRLQVVPSRLDALQPSILVEGKGDYLLLNYGRFLCDLDDGRYVIVPTRGADHFAELVGILLGWGVNFALCFDADKKGKAARDEYVSNWAFSSGRCFTLMDFDKSLDGKSIEGFLDDADIAIISRHYGIDSRPTKSQVQLFFSEKLSLRERVELSPNFKARITGFDALARKGLELSVGS